MPFSDEELKQRIGGQNWTAQNVRLSPAVTTMPETPDFFETDLRLKAILRALSFLYKGQLAGLRAADLGSLEGGFALALAQRGIKVMGIEARRKNVEKMTLLKEHFELENLNFVLDDVKNFTSEAYGMFDVTLALGILYHLDKPTAWLRQVARATRSLLIVDSHFAPVEESSLKQMDSRLKLGPLKKIDDEGAMYEGRWFFEHNDNTHLEDQLWSSYSNHSSFWPTKESLFKALIRAGFDLVLEQHDYAADFYTFQTVTYPRTLVLAIKSEGFRES